MKRAEAVAILDRIAQGQTVSQEDTMAAERYWWTQFKSLGSQLGTVFCMVKKGSTDPITTDYINRRATMLAKQAVNAHDALGKYRDISRYGDLAAGYLVLRDNALECLS